MNNGGRLWPIHVLVSIFVFISGLLASYYILNNVNHNGYELLFVLPILFGLMFALFLLPTMLRLNNIYIYAFIIISYVRYVVSPFLITYTGLYEGRSLVSPMYSSIEVALKLMMYELIIVSLAHWIVFKNYKNENNKITNNECQKTYSSNNFVYILFVTLIFGISLIFPVSLQSFNFFSIAPSYIKVHELNSFNLLIFYSLIVSKFIIFVLIIKRLHLQYQLNKNLIYPFLSFIWLVINLGIIYGNNRADYVVTSIASILIFNYLFPKYGKIFILPLVLIFGIVLSGINSFRNHASYSGELDWIKDLAYTLQIYLAGPYNVAISYEVSLINESSRNLLNLMYELLRPLFGINVLMQNIDYQTTVEFFNQRIFFTEQISQIIPMIGQGYFYFGFVFSPIFSVLFIFLVKTLMNIKEKSNDLVLKFFLLVPIIRLSFLTSQNSVILINDISFFLSIFIMVYYFNKKISLQKFSVHTLNVYSKKE